MRVAALADRIPINKTFEAAAKLFTYRGISIARPRNDASMIAPTVPRNPNR